MTTITGKHVIKQWNNNHNNWKARNKKEHPGIFNI